MSAPENQTFSAARRWDVAVLPDVIDADSEDEARAEFIQALVEDGSLIHVSEHLDVDIDVTGTDCRVTSSAACRCEHGCGREARVEHADGRMLCLPCYAREVGIAASRNAWCDTCYPREVAHA